MASSANNTNGSELSAAQRLLQTHAEAPHHVTVEEVPDEDLSTTSFHGGSSQTPSSEEIVSAKAAGKQKESQAPTRALDTQSHELFPELGASKPKGGANVAPVWGAKSNSSAPANGISRSSTPGSGVATPTGGVPSMVIPGRNVETVVLEPQYVLPRTELRRPIPDIIKEINRKSRANITMSTSGNGRLKFDATGQQDVAQQALKDLVEQIGTKTTIRVPIPQVARAHIIGKQGSTIKALQEKSGARIKLPKAEELGAAQDDDDDATIDVLVEGNALSAASARNEILKIAGERAANINVKLRDVPAQFYPFLVGPDRSGIGGLEKEGVHIRVPPYQVWASEPLPEVPPSGDRPQFSPAAQENLIHLAGQREAVHAARAEIQRRVAELRDQLLMQQFAIQPGRHQFIIGSRGVSPDEFFSQTGCTIFLPTDDDSDMITVIGPKQRIEQGMEHAMELAMNMQSSQVDISRFHRNAPDGARMHARHITRFLRQRDIISELERAHNTHITTPRNPDGTAMPWEVYARDGKNAIKAQSAISGVIHALPPSRITTVPVDPFFHAYLRKEVSPRMTQSHGVHVVLPGAEDAGAPVLLVFEGPSAAEPQHQIKTGAPSREEEETFRKSLEDARTHILDIINKQESIVSTSIDVPQIFHERLRRFIKKEQEKRSADQIPIRVSSAKTIVTLRGPASAVESLENKIAAFVAQEIEDEKERGLVTTFDFPQKFANHLIGKNGSHIGELRERFDVEIQVHDGKVELKGPKAKAEAAKSHINSLARTWADETTHIFKVEPKFHRELIGVGGSLINRLQNKYKVHIFFPKPAKSGKDDESNADTASDAGKPRRQQAPDEVIVRGPKKGADEARDEILSLVQYYRDNSFTATVTVQQKQVPSLIGQGGAALDELRQSTGAKIDIPGTRDTETIDIQIKGGKAEVAAAKKALEEKKAIFEDTVVKTIEVDKKFHKDLIGPGGAILRDIVVNAGGSGDRRELARTIQFPKQDADGNAIKIEGRSQVVDKICARIQEIVAERQSQVTEILDVPIEKHRSLIGRGGETKRQLEAQLGVSIDIPRQGDGKTGIKLTGVPDKLAKAKEHISSLVKEQEGETIMVPRNLHHAVSNNGQIFRQLRNNHQVTVSHDGHSVPPKSTATRANGGSLPLITDDEATTAEAHSWKVESLASTEDGDIPWVLRGSPENVEKAKAAIANALSQARKNTTIGLLVLPDPTTYRYVIGQGGSKVNSIRKQTGCKINVPRNDAKEDAIEITGSPEGVEKAKDLILEAVREGISSRSRD
ncbi:KH domain-containing protein [Sodiomyces alkalinus F11]|uniref:KH domain-containing protein n=1 Tax=Sodiomyces alkalinus (strain CBS 110278 / VKM F-3762 / F11) TaxID=1314773 RepID=A0A3N2PNZ9_SODAK|nr:KH domain-containing protein [Sodiomyces alkalinus F11]ROT36247.1 KH domain-containing protein [Sodiomyces alkalinus F11]